jgi:23S rRNA (uracil1939-C5)-methyltransferase
MDEGRYSVGQEVELAIGGYTSEGDGVGKLDGAVFFVPGALAEETIRARIAVVKKNHYIAALASVTAPAAARCEPPCPLYRECGGCQLQHIAYPEQLLLKERRVRDALERIGGFSGIVIHRSAAWPIPGATGTKSYSPLAEVDQIRRSVF